MIIQTMLFFQGKFSHDLAAQTNGPVEWNLDLVVSVNRVTLVMLEVLEKSTLLLFTILQVCFFGEKKSLSS